MIHPNWPLNERIRARIKSVIFTRLWGMDVHPTARIHPTALIDRTWPRGIHIGAGCVLGPEVVVLSHDLTRGLYLDTIIGEGCYLGPRSIVLPGVRIGKGCIIMPGALVIRDLEDGSIVSGNPATMVSNSTRSSA